MNLVEINKRLKAEADLRNNKPLDEFESRTPREMYYMLYDNFHPDSPFQFNSNINKEAIKEIPILVITIFFLKKLKESQTLKLTEAENLPLKIVNTIYDLGVFPNSYIDTGFSKIRSEKDLTYIHTMRLICELAGLTRKQHGRLTLTVKGNRLLKEENLYHLFKEVFITYTTKFNWSYNDHYGDNPFGQFGFAFSLELLYNYGDQLLSTKFYAQKYLIAFPTFLNQIEDPILRDNEEEAIKCYVYRTFHYFLKMFGMIKITEKGTGWNYETMFIKKSSFLEELIKFED